MDPLSLFYVLLACIAISFGTVKVTERTSGRLPAAVKTVETASREALQIVESRFEKWLADIEGRHAITRETLGDKIAHEAEKASEQIRNEAEKSARTMTAISADVSRLVGQMDAILMLASNWHPSGATATATASPQS